MKWVLIFGNIVLAIGLVLLGGMAAAAHRAHSYSTYREFQKQGMLLERPDYDVAQKLEGISAGGSYSKWIGWCGAAVCLANAAALAAFSPKPGPD